MGTTFGDETEWIKANPDKKRAFLQSFPCPKCGRTNIWKDVCWPRYEDDDIDADCSACGYWMFGVPFNSLHLAKQDMIQKEIKVNQHLAEKGLLNDAPWDTTYYDYPCPYCGKYKVRDAKWEDKQFSTAFWGFFSRKLHCHYKCDACKEMWE